MIKYGIIIGTNEEKHVGTILSQDRVELAFLYRDYKSLAIQPPRRGLPVAFAESPHRTARDRLIATAVRPTRLKSLLATVKTIDDKTGMLRLPDGREVYFDARIVDGSPQLGQTVTCIAVPGTGPTLFALAVETFSTSVTQIDSRTTQPQIGVSIRKGTSSTKSLCDDAFLVTDMADGDLWLIAIGDGVSNPPNGWWASNKCMELIWRLRATYEARLLDPATAGVEHQLLHDWINEIHKLFLLERRAAPSEFQAATSTLTLTIVRGRNIYWAHCGDTRLYVLSSAGKLSGKVYDRLTDRKSSGEPYHIGETRDWQAGLVIGGDTIPHGGLLILCSDGVIAGDKNKQKSDLLRGLGSTQRELQEQVDEITAKLSQSGERDDLTLIAFRPGAAE